MSSARLAFILSLALIVRAAGAQQFVYTPSALPAQNVWTDGVCIADIDNDGDNDILFANGSVYGGTGASGAQPQHLFLNDGSGVFTAAHANLNVANFNAKMVIAQDFDGDGDLDLFYASGSTGSPPRLLINQGGAQAGTIGIFTDMTSTNVPALALKSFCVCAGDVDNDGDLDVVVTDGGTQPGVASQARLLLNNGSAVFTDVTATNLPVDLFSCQDVTLLDFDGDYDIDIALTGKTGSRLYLNNGSGVFTVNTVLSASVGSVQTYEIDWGDLDGDNDFDAAVESITGFSEGWAKNQGTVTPVVKTTFSGTNGDDDNEMALLDYDNDGDLDVFVGSLGASEKVYRNTNGVFAFVPGVIQAQSDSTLDFGVGDLNNDGKYDLVTGQGESGNFTNKVYMNNGTADTLPPKLLGAQTPVIGNPATVFHVRVSDSDSDDGVTNVHVTYSWETSANPSGGSGTAFHQGEGLFRAPVPSPAGTTWISITYTATDSSGNATNFGPFTSGPAPVTFAGLVHTPLGQATLTPSGNLVVGNIGSSGQDGVSVALGASQGVSVDTVGLINPATAPAGAFLRFQGVHNNAAFTTSLTYEVVAGKLVVKADFNALGATAHRVQVFLDGTEVANVVHTSSVDMTYLSTAGASKESTVCSGQDATITYIHICDPSASAFVQLPDGSTVVGDTFQFSPVNATVVVTSSSVQNVLAKDVPPVQIVGESIKKFGAFHAAAGGATMQVNASDLTLGNIGSSGQDGVSVSLGKASSFSMTWNPLDLSAPDGSWVRAHAVGTVDGVPEQPLGSLTVTKNGATFDIAADFTDIGSPTQNLQVFNGASLVVSILHHSGLVGTMSTWPRKLGKLGGTTDCYTDCDPGGTLFVLDGITYAGTEVRVLADNTSESIDSKSSFELTASDLPQIAITSEVLEPSPFTDLGSALAGIAGLPHLSGSGTLGGATLNALTLTHAAPSAACIVFLSVSSTPSPFKGGVLVTVPVVLSLGLVTSPAGGIVLPFVMPAGFSGLTFYTQAGVHDTSAVQGVSLSNALLAVVP